MSIQRWIGVSVSVWLLGVVPAMGETVPVRGVLDSRIRTAVYDSEEVYRVQGYAGFEIDLQFEVGETFVGIGSGDIEGLSFVAQDNHLFIKPRAAKVSTNLTVLTTRRAYQFVYSAAAVSPSNLDSEVIFAVRFTYPRNEGDVAAADVSRMLEQAGEHRARNDNYWYCGSPSLKPIETSDDGVHTRLTFAARSEQPAIFALNEDGSESLVNFSMESGDVVIHRVVRRMIVRRGHLTGTILNKGYSGSGERLDSGTISPRVRRTDGVGHP